MCIRSSRRKITEPSQNGYYRFHDRAPCASIVCSGKSKCNRVNQWAKSPCDKQSAGAQLSKLSLRESCCFPTRSQRTQRALVHGVLCRHFPSPFHQKLTSPYFLLFATAMKCRATVDPLQFCRLHRRTLQKPCSHREASSIPYVCLLIFNTWGNLVCQDHYNWLVP